jgi:hypothetical protein
MVKIRLFMQSQSDDRKLASDDSHWSAFAQNVVLKGQWKTKFSQRPFRTQSFRAMFQPLRSWLISAVPSEQKSVFHLCSIPASFHYGAASRDQVKIRLFIKPYCGWCHKATRWLTTT